MHRRLIAAIMLGLLILGGLPGWQAKAAEEANQSQQVELTLDEAISRAISYSRELKSAKLDVYVAQENKWDARSGWKASYETDWEQGVEAKYAALLNGDYGYDSAVIQRDIKEDSVRAQARSGYYDVLQAIEKVDVNKSSLEYQQTSFNNAKATYDVGMLSSIGIIQAKLALVQKQADLTSAEHDLINAYISFNEMVGLDPEDRPVLTSLPVMETLEVNDVAAQISLIMDDSPNLDLVDAALDMKEELYWISSDVTAEDQLKQAELSAESTTESVRQGLYKVYYSTKNLEDSYSTAQNNLNLSQENLRIAKLKYDLGMNTKADVISAENSLLQAESSLLSILCNHDILKEAFYKPWAA